MIFPVNKPNPYAPQATVKSQQLQAKNNYSTPSHYYPQSSQLPQRTLPTQNPSNSLKYIPTINSPAKVTPTIFFQDNKPRATKTQEHSANKFSNVRSQSQVHFRKYHIPILNNNPIPPQKQSQSQKKTLVLDLDETLIHSSTKEPYSFDLCFSLRNSQKYFVIYRPGVQQFLKEAAEHFEVIVWTASIKEYADSIIDQLDPKKILVSFRLYRENCKILNNSYVKDLSMINRNLKDVIIVDNLATCFKLHQENGIQIVSFFDDSTDAELAKLLPFLKFLSSINDVRDVRSWANFFRKIQSPASVKNKLQNMLKNEQEERIAKERESKNLSTNDPYLVPQAAYNQFYRIKTCGQIPLHVQMTNELKQNAKEKQIQDQQANMFKQNSIHLFTNSSKSNSQVNHSRNCTPDNHRSFSNSSNLNDKFDKIEKEKQIPLQELTKQVSSSSFQTPQRQDISTKQYPLLQDSQIVQQNEKQQKQTYEISKQQFHLDDTFLYSPSYGAPRFLQLPNQSLLKSSTLPNSGSEKELSKTMDIQTTKLLPTLLKSAIIDDLVTIPEQIKYLQSKGENLEKKIDQPKELEDSKDFMNFYKNPEYPSKYQFYLSPSQTTPSINIYSDLKDSAQKSISPLNDKTKLQIYNSAVSTSVGDSDTIARYSNSQIRDSAKIQDVQAFSYAKQVSSFDDYPQSNPQLTKYLPKDIF